MKLGFYEWGLQRISVSDQLRMRSQTCLQSRLRRILRRTSRKNVISRNSCSELVKFRRSMHGKFILTFSQTLRHVPSAFVQHIDISEMKNDTIKHQDKNICLWTDVVDNRGWAEHNSCCQTTIKCLWQLQMAVSHTVWSFWSIPSNDRLYSPCQRLYSRKLVKHIT